MDLKARFFALMDEIGSVSEVARRLDMNRNTAYGWARQAGLSSRRLGHPGRHAYLQLRAAGKTQREAAKAAGVHLRTGRDWEHGVYRSRGSRFYPDGRRVNYVTGETTMESMTSLPTPTLAVVPESVSARLLSLTEREMIADRAARDCLCGRSGESLAGRHRPSSASSTRIPRVVGISRMAHIGLRPERGHARSSRCWRSRDRCGSTLRESSESSGLRSRSGTASARIILMTKACA